MCHSVSVSQQAAVSLQPVVPTWLTAWLTQSNCKMSKVSLDAPKVHETHSNSTMNSGICAVLLLHSKPVLEVTWWWSFEPIGSSMT